MKETKESRIYKLNSYPPITEWLRRLRLPRRFSLIKEDNSKRHRLDALHDIIDIPYQMPEKMMASDIINQTPIFLDAMEIMGDQECMLRLVPKGVNLPKYRIKGKTFRESIKWFYKKKVDPKKYWIEIVHREKTVPLSCIFIINEDGIWGEINRGRLRHLCEGAPRLSPVYFSYDYKYWTFSIINKRIERIVKCAIASLHTKHYLKRNKLHQKIGSTFTKQGYLKGYFEFVVSSKNKINFFDYNRQQDTTLKKFNIWQAINHAKQISKNKYYGVCANDGLATGIVKIISDPKNEKIGKGEILVCKSADINYALMMQTAKGMINEYGNILSHSSVIARELHKPLLIRVKNATKKLKNGDKIILNATDGFVEKI